MQKLRHEMRRPFNLNFFSHKMEAPDTSSIDRWRSFLRPHYERMGLNIESVVETRLRLPFDDKMCAVAEELRPEVVRFHFGLPTPNLVERLKGHGIKILASATSVREAKWLATQGCDAIIAQGQAGSTDYMQMWAGQAAALAKPMPAKEFTQKLAADVLRALYPKPGV